MMHRRDFIRLTAAGAAYTTLAMTGTRNAVAAPPDTQAFKPDAVA